MVGDLPFYKYIVIYVTMVVIYNGMYKNVIQLVKSSDRCNNKGALLMKDRQTYCSSTAHFIG